MKKHDLIRMTRTEKEEIMLLGVIQYLGKEEFTFDEFKRVAEELGVSWRGYWSGPIDMSKPMRLTGPTQGDDDRPQPLVW